MKKVFIGIGILVVLIIAAAIAAPFLVPVDTIKNEIIAGAEKATGRTLRIDGPVKLSFLPTIGVEASQVSFSNVQGAATKDMLTLAKLQVGLKLVPLLSGEVAIDQFVLTDPVINLEVDARGRPNWQFGTPAANGAAPAPASTSSSSSGGGVSSSLSQLRLGDVRLDNGTLTYRDDQAKTTQTISKINVKLKLPAINQPFDMDGSVDWNGKTVKVTGKVANPEAMLVDKKSSDVDLKVNTDLITLDFNGSVKTAPPLTVAGQVDLNVTSIRNVAQWTGNPISMPGNNLGPLAIKGKTTVNGAKYGFTDATINVDAIKSKGNLEYDGGAAKPYVKANLDVEMLDLNPYLPPEQQAAGGSRPAGAPAPSNGGSASKADDWSDAPIDVSALKAANADLALGVGGIKFRKIDIGKSALKVALKDGRMTADLTDLNLYEGKGSGQVVLDGSSQATGLQSNFKLDGLQVGPLLDAAADFKTLTGKGAMDVSLTSKGVSQRQLISALNGKGSLKMNDGTIKGIDFVRMLCNPLKAVEALGGKLDDSAKTEFSDLGANYTITNGILNNPDMAVQAPLFRGDGSGTVDLPKRTVNYRAVPKLVASCSGQGSSEAGKLGLPLPVVVTGPWSNVSVRPDFDPIAILKSVNPADALKNPGATLRGLLPGGSSSSGSSSSGTQQKSGVGDALKGLFGK